VSTRTAVREAKDFCMDAGGVCVDGCGVDIVGVLVEMELERVAVIVS